MMAAKTAELLAAAPATTQKATEMARGAARTMMVMAQQQKKQTLGNLSLTQNCNGQAK